MKISNLFYFSLLISLMLFLVACGNDEAIYDNVTNDTVVPAPVITKTDSAIHEQKDGTVNRGDENDTINQEDLPPPAMTGTAPKVTHVYAETNQVKLQETEVNSYDTISVGSPSPILNEQNSDTIIEPAYSKYKIDLYCDKKVFVNDTFFLNLKLKELLKDVEDRIENRPNQVQTTRQVLLNRGKRIKIKLKHAGLVLIDDDNTMENDCIYLNEMGPELERQYKLVALERGKKQIGATVYVLRDGQACNELSSHTLVAETLELYIDVNYGSNLWLTLWENIQKFWAALLLAVFTAILLFVKRKLKLKNSASNDLNNPEK